MRTTRRRVVALGAALAGTSLVLTACSGSTDPAGGDGGGDGVEIEVSWWGDDARAAIYDEIITMFEEETGITVVQTPVGSPDDLFNRLATDFAGGGDTAPDLFALGGAKPQEYGRLGALLDMADVADQVDMSQYPDFSTTNATVDGTVYGVPTGGNAIAAFVNVDIFEQAGVAVPEADWTWDDFVSAINEIGTAGLTNDNGDAVYGVDLRVHDILGTYTSQITETGMYTWEGGLGVDADDIAGWYEIEKQLLDGGGLPDPSIVTSGWSLTPDQQPFTLGQAAVTFGYSNLAGVYAGAGEQVEMMLPPSDTGVSGVGLLPAGFWSINAASEHPEEAAMLMDFFLHDERALELILDSRGMPFTEVGLDAVTPHLDEFGQQTADYVNVVLEEGVVAPPQPDGGQGMNELSQRMESEVLFGTMTPEQAAEQWITELGAELGQ